MLVQPNGDEIDETRYTPGVATSTMCARVFAQPLSCEAYMGACVAPTRLEKVGWIMNPPRLHPSELSSSNSTILTSPHLGCGIGALHIHLYNSKALRAFKPNLML